MNPQPTDTPPSSLARSYHAEYPAPESSSVDDSGVEPSMLRRLRNSTNASRAFTGAWTDHRGTAHLRESRSRQTLCGIRVDLNVVIRATSGCAACVTESFNNYARHHECGSDCRSGVKEHLVARLDSGKPSAPETARPDRRVSWSGLISAVSEPCRDLERMERLHHL